MMDMNLVYKEFIVRVFRYEDYWLKLVSGETVLTVQRSETCNTRLNQFWHATTASFIRNFHTHKTQLVNTAKQKWKKAWDKKTPQAINGNENLTVYVLWTQNIAGMGLNLTCQNKFWDEQTSTSCMDPSIMLNIKRFI